MVVRTEAWPIAESTESRDDLNDAIEPSKVVGVVGVQGQLGGGGRRGDQQVHGTSSPGLATSGDYCCTDPPVCPRSGHIERHRVESGFSPLETILASCSLSQACGGVQPGRQLGEGARADRERMWQICGLDGLGMQAPTCR